MITSDAADEWEPGGGSAWALRIVFHGYIDEESATEKIRAPESFRRPTGLELELAQLLAA